MNIKKQLLLEHTKINCQNIAFFIHDDTKKFDELVKLMLTRDNILAQRASHSLQFCIDKFPELITPYTEHFITVLQKNPIDAIKRAITRSWERIELEKEYHGIIIQLGFDYLQSPKEAIAPRAYFITIVHNLVLQYPELESEFGLVLLDLIENEKSPALTGRAKKVLKQLKNL